MRSDLDRLLDTLPAMSVDELRGVWRERFGAPPPIRSGHLLRRTLAERLQLEAHGREVELDRELAKLARRHRVGRRPEAARASFRAGSRLTRDWGGVRHTVEVVDGGYVWNGQRHDSLSKIAREITGVRWNGPRFFGLRDASRCDAAK